MKLKVRKLHPDVVLPKYANPGDNGLDLYAVDITVDNTSDDLIYDTGIAVEIPEGYVGMVFMRSSVYKTDVTLRNAVGIIDSSYRGNIILRFIPTFELWSLATNNNDFYDNLRTGKLLHYETAEQCYRELAVVAKCYKLGDKIAQLLIIPCPVVEVEEVEELSETVRGNNGFGSTGL